MDILNILVLNLTGHHSAYYRMQDINEGIELFVLLNKKFNDFDQYLLIDLD